MNSDIEFINFKYIDTKIGLEYLNHNKELYIKILKNFLNRYEDLNIESLDNKSINDTLHTIKGLSATLGMTNLYNITKTIYEQKNKTLLSIFSDNLILVINELRAKLKDEEQKSILIINDNIIDIDILVELLEDRYDILVALDEATAIESIDTEKISMVLLDANMLNIDSFNLYNFIKSKIAPILFTVDGSKIEIMNRVLSITPNKFITKPFNKKELIKTIDINSKLKSII